MQSLAASFAVALCGAVWGVYWLPLRYLDQLGLSGGWATFAFFLVCLPPGLALGFAARAQIKAHMATFLWLALLNGLTFILYSNAYGITTVFNTLFLFYLSPIWSIVIARLWLGERTGAARIGCVIMGLAGLVLMLSADGGWPVPRNLGDWMALTSGITWAIVSVKIRNSAEFGVMANSAAFFLGGIGLSLLFAVLLDGAAPPAAASVHDAWRLVLAVGWLLWLPSQFLLFWGVRRISPVRTGILLMTELISGVVTAALLSGDPFTWRQGIGGALIVAAGLGDILSSRNQPTPAPIPLTAAQE
ncbi:MAG: DMT family transporter [Dongiaceae bacterium]